jgi:hypothetical protein
LSQQLSPVRRIYANNSEKINRKVSISSSKQVTIAEQNENKKINKAGHTPVITTLRTLRQEGKREFKVRLGYMA